MKDHLEGAEPRLVAHLPAVLAEMGKRGHPMIMFAGRRTPVEQYALWRKGRTLPGPRVTNCDGTVKKSKHQVQADGFHHAIDCVFLDAQGRVTWEGPWPLFGELVRATGVLRWGGDFKKRLQNGKLVPNPDSPHVEV